MAMEETLADNNIFFEEKEFSPKARWIQYPPRLFVVRPAWAVTRE